MLLFQFFFEKANLLKISKFVLFSMGLLDRRSFFDDDDDDGQFFWMVVCIEFWRKAHLGSNKRSLKGVRKTNVIFFLAVSWS